MATAVAILPIVVAFIGAAARGWIPLGDNGLLVLRTEDVLTEHHPLLGTWTSASVGAGRQINNPGPLWFDLLAPFVRIGGPAVGLALGVAVFNAACIALAAWAARRIGGYRALLLVTALSAGIAWSMGSELLFDPWQPHAMILPFWSFLIVTWALATGDLLMAPFALGLASLIIQTHLSFVYTIVLVGVAGAGLGVWSFRRAPAPRPQWRRPLLASVVVLVLAWIQPIIDQVAGEGNLMALLETRGSDRSATYPLGFSLRVVASVVAIPPWWGRPGFSTADALAGPSAAVAVVGLAIVVALLGVVVAVGWRRRSPAIATIGALALVALGAAIISMKLSPVGAIGFSLHQLRWLWPVSAFVFAAVLFALATWGRARHVAKVVLAGATAVLAVLALPRHVTRDGPAELAVYQPVVVELIDQIETYRPDQPVVFDTTTLRYNEPYSGPVIAALARGGVDVVTSDEVMSRQIGTGRRADGTERRQVFLREGNAATSTPDGARRVAYVPGLDGAEDLERLQLRSIVIDAATAGGVRLNAAGLDAVAAGETTFSEVVLEPGSDAAGLADEGWLAYLINE
ncbi:MAG: hypothetical protein ACRDZ2_13405, partial [Ilumatobacteraceae bacterium]